MAVQLVLPKVASRVASKAVPMVPGRVGLMAGRLDWRSVVLSVALMGALKAV